MKDFNDIKTIEALREQQKALKMEMDVTKWALKRNVTLVKDESKRFLLLKVALPAAVTAIGVVVLNKLLSKNKPPAPGRDHGHTNDTTRASLPERLTRLTRWIPLAKLMVGFLAGYLKAKKEDEH